MKFPFVTRTRYERELAQIERAYSTSSDELRHRLESLIDKIVLIKFDRYEDQKQVIVRVAVSEKEDYYFSPFERENFWWHIGQKITNSLKREVQLQSIARTEAIK